MQKLLILFCILFVNSITQAQVVKPAAGFKAPIVTATIGKLVTGTYTVAQLKKIIDSALVLKDAKGNKYTIDKCSFLYKRKTKFEDDETGKKGTGWEYVEKILKNGAQLDSLWKTTIKNELQAGEELMFANIMADSKKGFKIPVASIILTAQ
jgi:hypothetical protein